MLDFCAIRIGLLLTRMPHLMAGESFQTGQCRFATFDFSIHFAVIGKQLAAQQQGNGQQYHAPADGRRFLLEIELEPAHYFTPASASPNAASPCGE